MLQMLFLPSLRSSPLKYDQDDRMWMALATAIILVVGVLVVGGVATLAPIYLIPIKAFGYC